MNPNISVIVAAYNEQDSLPTLQAWIAQVMQANSLTYEVLYIDDGSQDATWSIIEALHAENPTKVAGIRLRKNLGKSAALQKGFDAACGSVVITLDADLQDSPDEIPCLYQRLQAENLDLISGWKQKRHDPLSKTIPTKLFNWVTRKMFGIKLHDFNCGLKAYRLAVVKSIQIYGDLHRYIPVLAAAAGFTRIGEQIITHYPRKYGQSKFGMNRFSHGFLDLLSLFVVNKFSKRPMHFFGGLGVVSMGFGMALTLWLIAQKLWAIAQKGIYREVTANPLFFMALSAIIIGFQLFLTGFLAELWVRSQVKTNEIDLVQEVLPPQKPSGGL